MVSPATAPYIRPPSTSFSKKAQGPRPPPLNLNSTKKFTQRSTVKAVRGSVCWSDEGTEVPLIMDLAPNRSAPGHSAAKASGILGATPRELAGKDSFLNQRPDVGEDNMDRPVSPQRSLRTIIDLDSPLGSDEESDVSPISEDRPYANSSKVLARFFPELQGNFAVMPPEGAESKPKDTKPRPRKVRSRAENEIEERVQTLYHNSTREQSEDPLETGAASTFDARQSTIVFDDDESTTVRKGADRRMSRISRILDDAASSKPMALAAKASKRSQQKIVPSRYDSTSSKMSKTSLQDLRYKPLPLAPVMEPNSDERSRPSTSRYYTDSAQRPHNVPHSIYANQSHRTHRGHSTGRHEHRGRDGSASRSDHHGHHGHHSQQQGPWRHATEELEITYGVDDGRSGRRVLVLDGPLQISRNNHGDLVAARPAPLPPSTKPYSEVLRLPLEVLKQDARRTGSAASTSSKKQDKAHKHTRSKDSNESIRDCKVKAKDESKKDRWSSNSKSSDGSKTSELQKLKKSFSITRHIQRKQNQNAQRDQRRFSRLSTLSSRSETAVDPQDDDLAKSDGELETRRVSRHLSQSHPNLDVVAAEVADDDSEDSGSNKRDDLLLQLPRLQTDNLDFKTLLEQFAPESRSALVQPPIIKPVYQEDTRDAKEVIAIISTPAPPQKDDKIAVIPTPIPQPRIRNLPPSQKMRQSTAFVSTSKASSVYLHSDKVYELAAGPPSPTVPPVPGLKWPQPKPKEFNIPFPTDMIKDVFVELLMERVDSLDDLFNVALITRRFYRIFKQRELFLIKNALFKMSRPAWELREMSPPWTTEWQLVLDPDSQVPEYTGASYLDRYAQDIFVLAQLKSMVLMRCAPFLRRDTIRGLAGLDEVRAEEVDNAFWRIWTFCRIFGSGKRRENDIEGQVDWLKGGKKAKQFQGAASNMMTEPFGVNNVLFEPPEGFSRGNHGGLTPTELYDMTEIWNCLNVLVQPLHGKCIEARKVGVFDSMDVPDNDPVREETVLEEWTSWVLTLGMSAVLAVSSINPSETPVMIFTRAKELGLTKWELTETRIPRRSFLKEAVSRAYEEQERSLTLPSGSSDSPCELPSDEVPTRGEEMERRQVLSMQIRQQRARGTELPSTSNTFNTERPMSMFSTILGNLEGTVKEPVPPVPPVPGLASDRSSTSTEGHSPAPPGTPNTGRGTPELTAVQNHYTTTNHHITSEPFNSRPRSPHTLGYAPAPLQPQAPRPQVQDPVDRAISRMVNQLGFNEDDVKWALKITDTGEGINVEAAEQLLQQQKKKSERNPFVAKGKNPTGKNSLLMSVIKQQGSQDSGWRWA